MKKVDQMSVKELESEIGKEEVEKMKEAIRKLAIKTVLFKKYREKM